MNAFYLIKLMLCIDEHIFFATAREPALLFPLVEPIPNDLTKLKAKEM